MAKTKRSPSRRRVILIAGGVGLLAIAVVIVLLVALRKPESSSPKFDYAAQPMLGNPRAPVKVVEFFDFKCPSCKWFHDNIFPLLKRQYIDNGTVSFYAMNFPFIGPDSTTAAMAGEAVFHQNADDFWPYWTAIFDAQEDEHNQWATPELLVSLANRVDPSLDTHALSSALDTGKYRNDVEADYLAGQLAGVNSTPTIFVNGTELPDFRDFAALQKLIDRGK